MKLNPFFILLTVFVLITHAQELQNQQLDSVLISSTRIDLPFKENSRTITVISALEIKNAAATNVADLLQQVTGVDIRRRGTGGSQADLQIEVVVLIKPYYL